MIEIKRKIVLPIISLLLLIIVTGYQLPVSAADYYFIDTESIQGPGGVFKRVGDSNDFTQGASIMANGDGCADSINVNIENSPVDAVQGTVKVMVPNNGCTQDTSASGFITIAAAGTGGYNDATPPAGGGGSSGSTWDITKSYTPIEGSECEGDAPNCCNGVVISLDVDCVEGENPAAGYLYGVMNVLAGGVGTVIVAVLVYSGIEMMTARGQPDKIQQGKKRLTNALIALVGFIFLYAFLQWLVPGGIGG